jgi:protein-S-isoprenylcysteine O-methyltransferase Ste14
VAGAARRVVRGRPGRPDRAGAVRTALPGGLARLAGSFHLAGLGRGGSSLLAGAWLFATAVLRLGSNLAAVPFPKDGSSLVETGPYRLVRHPIYCGIVSMAFGWAFLVHGWLTFLYALAMLAFFDIKSRREEQWLVERYPDYAAYRKRVHKLIPFIY